MTTIPAQALAARAIVETALDHTAAGGRWPWSLPLSRWLDALVILEEAGA